MVAWVCSLLISPAIQTPSDFPRLHRGTRPSTRPLGVPCVYRTYYLLLYAIPKGQLLGHNWHVSVFSSVKGPGFFSINISCNKPFHCHFLFCFWPLILIWVSLLPVSNRLFFFKTYYQVACRRVAYTNLQPKSCERYTCWRLLKQTRYEESLICSITHYQLYYQWVKDHGVICLSFLRKTGCYNMTDCVSIGVFLVLQW